MSEKKALIFVQPYSDTLRQLKEVIEEGAEGDGIEIFEVESLNEMGQLLPTIGPSLTIISNPRKCAMLLQANRKVVMRMKSKVILLSPKVIPRRTLEKFMKIALTDCITEPVAPKTLLYKVKLMLRSLPSILEEEDQDVVITADEDENRSNDEAQHIEKGVKLDGHLKGKVNEDDDISLKLVDEEDEGIHSQSEAERKKDDLLRGDIGPELKLEDEEDDDTQEKNYDGPIDGYYRGAVKASLNLEDDEQDSNDVERESDHDDLLEKAKQEISLDLADDDIYQEKAEEETAAPPAQENDPLAKLNLEEEEDPSASLENHNKIDGHLRGSVNNLGLDLEEEEIEQEAPEMEEKGKINNKNTGTELSLEDEDDIELEKEEDLTKGTINNKDNPMLSLEDEDDQKELQKTDQAKPNEMNGKGLGADQFDKYYKGDSEGLSLNLEDESDDDLYNSEREKERSKDREKKTSLDLEEDLKLKEGSSKKDSDINPILELEHNLTPEEKELDHEKITAQDKKKKSNKDPNINLELDEFKERKKKEAEDASKKLQEELRRKKLKLEDEENNLDLAEDKEKEKNRRKNEKSLELDLEDEEGRKIKNHGVDHIQKYYGVKSSDTLEKGADWNNLNKKEETLDFPDAETKKEDRELIIPKIDRGEQTIDYSKLKEQFDITITTNRDKKVTDGEYDISSNKKNSDPKSESNLDIPEQDLFEEALTEEEEEIIQSKETVYVPDSCGIEYVIKMASNYLDPKKDLYRIHYQIANDIFKETKGITSFYSYNPQSELFIEEYAGHLFIDTGVPKEVRENKWTNLKKDNLTRWKETKLPTWSDHTFQENTNEFVYPFFLSIHHMGFAVVSFANKLPSKDAAKIEIILESARGGYLSQYNAIIGATEKNNEEKNNKKSVKKGFLKGLFKKKAS